MLTRTRTPRPAFSASAPGTRKHHLATRSIATFNTTSAGSKPTSTTSHPSPDHHPPRHRSLRHRPVPECDADPPTQPHPAGTKVQQMRRVTVMTRQHLRSQTGSPVFNETATEKQSKDVSAPRRKQAMPCVPANAAVRAGW